MRVIAYAIDLTEGMLSKAHTTVMLSACLWVSAAYIRRLANIINAGWGQIVTARIYMAAACLFEAIETIQPFRRPP